MEAAPATNNRRRSLSRPCHSHQYLHHARRGLRLRPHYDVHDVFVFQISGSKHWKIYSPIFDPPHASQPFRPQMFTQSAPLLELDIEPGDLLYLPRGFVHTTNTTDHASAHVTLGVTVYTWMELLAIWLQSSKNDVAFRRALPPGFASRPELKQGLKDGIVEVVSDCMTSSMARA